MTAIRGVNGFAVGFKTNFLTALPLSDVGVASMALGLVLLLGVVAWTVDTVVGLVFDGVVGVAIGGC